MTCINSRSLLVTPLTTISKFMSSIINPSFQRSGHDGRNAIKSDPEHWKSIYPRDHEDGSEIWRYTRYPHSGLQTQGIWCRISAIANAFASTSSPCLPFTASRASEPGILLSLFPEFELFLRQHVFCKWGLNVALGVRSSHNRIAFILSDQPRWSPVPQSGSAWRALHASMLK
jgi:hypothetical protein